MLVQQEPWVRGTGKNDADTELSQRKNDIKWSVIQMSVKDIKTNYTIDNSHGNVYNFIVHDSAIAGNYTMNVYQSILNWNGISANLSVRVYSEDDTDILSADYTVIL